MGGRRSSAGNVSKIEKEYKERKFDATEELLKNMRRIKQQEKNKWNKYVKQGISQPEAIARAKKEFENEYERIEKIRDKKWEEATKEYKKKLGIKY